MHSYINRCYTIIKFFIEYDMITYISNIKIVNQKN